MKFWKVLVLVLAFAVTLGISLHCLKMLTGLWTVEVFQEGFENGLRNCPKPKKYRTTIYLPNGETEQVILVEQTYISDKRPSRALSTPGRNQVSGKAKGRV
jgi:hypothetical protein